MCIIKMQFFIHDLQLVYYRFIKLFQHFFKESGGMLRYLNRDMKVLYYDK